MQLTQLIAKISLTLCWRSNVFHCWSCVTVLLLCITIWMTRSGYLWQIHSQIFTNELFLPRLKIIVKMMNTRKDLLCSCYCNFFSLSRSWCSCPLIENESIAYSFSFISQWMTFLIQPIPAVNYYQITKSSQDLDFQVLLKVIKLGFWPNKERPHQNISFCK